jgi:hypothetical protein
MSMNLATQAFERLDLAWIGCHCLVDIIQRCDASVDWIRSFELIDKSQLDGFLSIAIGRFRSVISQATLVDGLAPESDKVIFFKNS